jgi:hypothetical protein
LKESLRQRGQLEYPDIKKKTSTTKISTNAVTKLCSPSTSKENTKIELDYEQNTGKLDKVYTCEIAGPSSSITRNSSTMFPPETVAEIPGTKLTESNEQLDNRLWVDLLTELWTSFGF